MQYSLDKLKELGLLLEHENVADFRSDFYNTKLWAEVFWSRKYSHERRLDPEIDVVKKYNPKKVLEIGSGYGRFTLKLTRILEDASIHGVETCTHFKKYVDIYTKDNPKLMDVTFSFVDFFNNEEFTEKNFDQIILPMNTLSSFPLETYPQIFEKVKDHLTKDGKFIFSTHKGSPEKIEEYLKHYLERYSSEMILRWGIDRILVEDFNTDYEVKNYGAKINSLKVNTRFDFNYSIIERNLFTFHREYIFHEFFDNYIRKLNFEIVEKDSSSHSNVYVLQAIR